MNLKSKYGYLIILIPVFIIFSLLFFGWFFEINLSKKVKLPIAGTCFVIILISALLSTSILFVIQLKKITITDEGVFIKLIFQQKTYNYKRKDIIGWNELQSFDNFGVYKTFNIKMSDNSIFMLQSRNFRNYNELVGQLINNVPQIELKFNQNLIPLLISFTITTLFLASVFYLSYIN